MMETVILVAWGAAMFLMAGALVYCRDDIRRLDRLIKMVRRDLDVHIDAVHRRIKELDEKIDDVKGDTALIEMRMSKVMYAGQQNCKHKWGFPHKMISQGPMNFIRVKHIVRCENCGMEKYIDEKEAQKLTAAYHKRKAAEAEKE